MTRKELLQAAGALAIPNWHNSTMENAQRPLLKLGDLVAIAAPAGKASGDDSLEKAKANVESLGLRVKVMPNAGKAWGYLAGTDEERAADFNAALRDPEVRGIICLRGGYGTMRILPLLDYDAFAKDPKVVLGYSDITGILNALTRKTGIVTYHGPIAEAKFLGFEGEQVRKALFGKLDRLESPRELRGKPVHPAPATIQPGKAKGKLVGGNLSLISPCAATPFGPDFTDSILFLEDINEAPYRVDRMLTGLWLAGAFEKVKGIALGDFRPSEDEEGSEFSTLQVLEHLKQWTKVPIFTGLYAGHIADKLTLPIGAMVEMDADARTLTVLGD